MDENCTVTFEGSHSGTYIVPCDRVEYINDSLVNTGSSSFNGYLDYPTNNTNNYITFPADSYPYYRSSGVTNSYITNASNVTFNNRAHFYREYDIAALLVMAVIAVCSLTRMWRS